MNQKNIVYKHCKIAYGIFEFNQNIVIMKAVQKYQ
jgi:hypothetical protein